MKKYFTLLLFFYANAIFAQTTVTVSNGSVGALTNTVLAANNVTELDPSKDWVITISPAGGYKIDFNTPASLVDFDPTGHFAILSSTIKSQLVKKLEIRAAATPHTLLMTIKIKVPDPVISYIPKDAPVANDQFTTITTPLPPTMDLPGLDKSTPYTIKLNWFTYHLVYDNDNTPVPINTNDFTFTLKPIYIQQHKISKIILQDDDNKPLLTFNVPQTPDNTDPATAECNKPLLSQLENYAYRKYAGATILPGGKVAYKFCVQNYGIILDKKKPYGGPNFVHLFYDQYGNSLFTTPPAGIPTIQYVVHIIYKAFTPDGKPVYMSLAQTGGTYDDALVLEGQNGAAGAKADKGTPQSAKDLCAIVDNAILLSTATTDISFDIINVDETGKSTVVSSQKIKMSRIYQGNIGIGLQYSSLDNSSYSLVTSPLNDANTVVKRSGYRGGRALVSIMSTFYWSPITSLVALIQKGRMNRGVSVSKLVDKPVADFQNYSKSNLYMRPFWERIYPTIGVCMNDQSFQNFLFGASWEFARGGSLFIGGHMAQVNTFSAPGSNFSYGVTETSQSQFNIATDRQFQVGWCIGATVDFTIFSSLFPKF